MTSTPERRESSGSVQSNRNLVFGNNRRYSRVYDQPIVQNTQKGPKVRVEMEDGTSVDVSRPGSRSTESFGIVLNPETAILGSLFAKISIGSLSLLAIIISVVGKTTLLATSQLFGFMFMFAVCFALSSGLYLWWSSSNKETVPLTNRTVLYLYLSSVFSSLLSQVMVSFTALHIASSLPQEASYYIFYVTMLFILFSLVVHRDSLNGMFSQETCLFVGLTVVLDFIAMCLFGDILSTVIYTQLPLSSMLMGTSLSLAGKAFPHLSPGAIYRALKHGSHKGGGTHSHLNTSGRSKRVSDISLESSVYPRNSVSSYSSFSYANQSSRTNESELITEAHGLISDLLLAKETLNSDIQTKLKRVLELLNPREEKNGGPARRVYVGDHISYDRHDYEDDIHTPISDHSAISSSQSSTNRLSVAGNRPIPKHRNSMTSATAYQRQSVSTFSVATSASGMPVLDSEPMDRKRSVALREVRARISVQEKRHSVHKMSRERLGSFERLSKPSTPTRTQSPHSPLTRSTLSTSDYKSDGEMSDGESLRGDPLSAGSSRSSLDGRQPVATPPESPKFTLGGRNDTLMVISEEGMEGMGRPRSFTAPSVVVSPSPLSGQLESKDEPDEPDESQTQFWTGKGGRPSSGYVVFSNFIQPPDYELTEYCDNNLNVFEQVGSWDFPIFELEERAGNHILSQMAYVLFQESGLIDTFKIPQRKFVNFFRALETNYGSNVYHNKTHAADVLHGVSYLLFEMIPGFSHAFSGGTEREWKVPSHGKVLTGNIASAFSILEVFACYMAAAMHDFDHPGRTNAFLVATKSPLAILYNDRSVLENHHAAASWDLLTCVPSHNFLDCLDDAELKRFRFLIVEAILATDLKMHFEILANFKAKTNPEEGDGIDWMSEVDRLMVMKMIIKMADINTPTKSFDLHRSWTERITEEFYQQAEQEATLGLPPTIFMDRNHPEKLPAIQLSFIQHLVSPLFQGCAAAGIIPGILETTSVLPEEKSDGEDSEPEHKEEGLEVGDDAFTIQEDGPPAQNFMSILLTNLEVNYDGWRVELPSEDTPTEEEEKVEKEDTPEIDESVSPAKTEDIETPISATIPQVTVSNE